MAIVTSAPAARAEFQVATTNTINSSRCQPTRCPAKRTSQKPYQLCFFFCRQLCKCCSSRAATRLIPYPLLEASHNMLHRILPLLILLGATQAAYKLQERYSWNQLDFAFPNDRLKEQAIASGDYIPQNALPVGIEHFGNRLFVTVPRWRDGKSTQALSLPLLGIINTARAICNWPIAR